jgi:hypothetical protein
LRHINHPTSEKIILEKSNFGKIKFWKNQILEKSNFGKIKFWKNQILEKSNFGKQTVIPYV